jgi:hypothetical protein
MQIAVEVYLTGVAVKKTGGCLKSHGDCHWQHVAIKSIAGNKSVQHFDTT